MRKIIKVSKKSIIFKNGIAGLTSQCIAQILQFFIRRYILQFIGVEVLGISSTLTSVISMLSLSELGFQQAVVFYLYKPLNETDNDKINSVLTVLKRVYEVIGIIFIVGTLIMSMFLKYILKGVVIDGTIYLYYFAISLNMVMSYILSYRRALLYADQKEYISQTIDSITNVSMCIVKLIAICRYKNFLAYLIIQVMQTMISNLIISRYCKYKYPYLRVLTFDWDIFRSIFKDVKNVFTSKLAGYIYGSTDNLVISACIGTINVGLLSNYTIFITAIKQIVNSIFNSMTPIIGNMLVENEEQHDQENKFEIYAYLRYLLATVIVVPWVLLANDLIAIVFGIQYILDNSIIILLAIDLYIHIVYSACCEYINGCGLFKLDRNIAITGAVINLVCSIVLVIKLDIVGVLLGTVVSQVFFWVARSRIVFTKILKTEAIKYWKYLIQNVYLPLSVCGTVLISKFMDQRFTHNNAIFSFIRLFIICEVINGLVQIAILGCNKRQELTRIKRKTKVR